MNKSFVPLKSMAPLKPSKGYEYYWRFAYERQSAFLRKMSGQKPPWTTDKIIGEYKFTNAYRASDRVSQYLIRKVIYDKKREPEDSLFRILLFKIFNKIETWELLENEIGEIEIKNFSFKAYNSILSKAKESGKTIYSGAYIMPSGNGFFPHKYKHTNHLELLKTILFKEIHLRIIDAKSMRKGFELLKAIPTFGDFLAYQYIVDINYSDVVDFTEMEFVVAGPGAKDGIRKCFVDFGGLNEEEIIKIMTERQEEEFSRLGLHFKNLWGRPLQLIDCQNLFCEVDKYLRVKMPQLSGKTGRMRIKQKYKPTENIPSLFYPPKWKINQNINFGSLN